MTSLRPLPPVCAPACVMFPVPVQDNGWAVATAISGPLNTPCKVMSRGQGPGWSLYHKTCRGILLAFLASLSGDTGNNVWSELFVLGTDKHMPKSGREHFLEALNVSFF